MPNVRRLGRVMAMQALYEIDAVGHDPVASLAALAMEHEATDEARDFAAHLVQGVLEHLERIDAMISATAPERPLEQVARVNKVVLRLAVYELHYAHDAPARAVINEAIEIAKEYGGESSGRFVNGVLGHLAAQPD